MPKYTQPRKTWQFTSDFKIKAVKLSFKDGLQVRQVAEGLDIHSFMLSCWRIEYREGKLQGVFEQDTECAGAQTRAASIRIIVFRINTGLWGAAMFVASL